MLKSEKETRGEKRGLRDFAYIHEHREHLPKESSKTN
jgi:hypothetical protein